MPSFFSSVRSFFNWNVEKPEDSEELSQERDSDGGIKTSGIRHSLRRKRKPKVKAKRKHQNTSSHQQNKISVTRSNSVSVPKKHGEQQHSQGQIRHAQPSFTRNQSNEVLLFSKEAASEPQSKSQRKRKYFTLPSKNSSKNSQEVQNSQEVHATTAQVHRDPASEVRCSQPSAAFGRTCDDDFRELSCFHGTLSRDAAEALLVRRQTPGSYLVRESPRKHQRLVLSVDSGETIYHFSLERHSDGQVQLESSSRRFPTMRSLLDHYSRRPVARGCTLSTPLCKDSSSDTADVEISPEMLQIKQKIGSGKFGSVLLGYLKPFGNVALKTYAEQTYTGQEMESYTREIRIMKSLRHPNVVRMLGTSSTSGNVTLILEFAELGDLHSYISRLNKQGKEVNSRCLSELARQVASGMAYLEEERIVHRDLAARNILLTATLNAKIGDFSLAIALQAGETERTLLEYERRPVRWMPLESILEGRYSSRSDVWAYGVLLWEMYSPGQPPYAGIDDDEIVTYLSSGCHLRCPVTCPEDLSTLMFKCWHHNPLIRPSFAQICSSLGH